MSNKIIIDGVTYIPESEATSNVPSKSVKGMKYVICRTYSAGVHAGYLKESVGKEATLINSRRLWFWSGAASLSQLAVDGVSKPNDCKFPCELPELKLTEVIEYIPCTEKARLSIASVNVWKM
jgi:hypothetical protein